jgi:hypothetical protein
LEKDFSKIIEIKEREQHRVKLFMDQINQGVVSEFVFEAPLDPALFSTEPPKEYTDLQPHVSPPPDRPLQPGHFELGRIVPAPEKPKSDKPSE